MTAVRTGRLWRTAARYTVALWVAGYLWAAVDLVAMGRFYGTAAVIGDIPCLAFTILLALALQNVVIGTDARPPASRAVAVGVTLMLVSLSSGGIAMLGRWYVATHFVTAMRDWAPASIAEWMRVAFVYGWMYSLNIALVLLAVTTENARRQAALLVEAREAAQIAELTMLRYQLNPHFLFNSLNAISSLVVTKRNGEAERMIERLATFLRATSASDPGGFVTLADELSTMQDYLDVEAVRFGDRMSVDFDIATDTGDVLVPSFLLQPIVENAIKYAIAPRRGEGMIRIKARIADDRLRLTISDDGPAETLAAGGTGIGLPNVCARLRAFYGEVARCEAGQGESGFVVAIELPAWRYARGIRPPAAPARGPVDAVGAERLVASAIGTPPIPSFR